MIIDAHAHACGEYFDYDSIINVLDENNTDQVVLCPKIAKKTPSIAAKPFRRNAF